MGPIQVVVQDGNNLVLEVTPTPNTTIILDRGIAGPPGPQGQGDVDGPASATDNAVARFDGTTGKLIQNSVVTIGDTGNISGVGTLAVTDLTDSSLTSGRVVYAGTGGNLIDSANLTFSGADLTVSGAVNATSGLINANTSSNALRITQTGTGNALLVEDSANPDATPFVITADGNVVIGGTAPLATGLSLINSGSFTPVIASRNTTNDSGYSYLDYQKSRAGGIVQSGDGLGAIIFNGFDGTAFRQSASIRGDVDGTPGTNDMPGRLVFSTTADGASSPTEAMRIDNAQRVGIGGSAPAGTNLLIAKNITGAATGQAIRIAGQLVQSDVTSEARGVISLLGTAASTFTLGNLQHFFAGQGSFGAGSTVTFQYGYFAASTLTGATNNYGFFSDIASGTGRWNFYANGTAANYFAGNVGIGNTSPTERLTVTGNAAISGTITEAGQPVVVQTDIGTAPNEIPLNQYLGEMAYMNAESVVIQPQASTNPAGIGDMVFQLTNNTTLVIKVKGSDGTIRSTTLTLA